MYKFLSLIVAALFLSACASPAVAPTFSALPTDTLIVVETATVPANMNAVDLTPTAPAIETQPAPTAAPTAEAGIPPEILTALDVKDARSKILPYCVVHPDLSDDYASTERVFAELPQTDIGKKILAMVENNEISGYGLQIVNQLDGSGGCTLLILNIHSSPALVWFESRINNSWVEVKLTGKE